MFNSSSIYGESWCRTVFANRNQAYGAYDLRKVSERNTLTALLLTTTLVIGTSMYVVHKNHGVPTPPDISLSPATAPDSLSVIQMDLTKPEPPVVEATVEPPSTPDPATAKPDLASDNTNIEIVKDLKETDKQPVTNATSSSQSTGTTDNTAIATTTTSGTEHGTTGGTSKEGDPEGFIKVAEVMPEFPGGVKALMSYIASNTSYPEIAKEIDKEGTVYVTFIVERNGEVSNVHIEKSVFKPIDNEAVRVVKSMPTWKPGLQNGQPVRVQFTVPIRFVLS